MGSEAGLTQAFFSEDELGMISCVGRTGDIASADVLDRANLEDIVDRKRQKSKGGWFDIAHLIRPLYHSVARREP